MELKAYLSPLFRYWWLLLLSAVIAASSSFLVTRKQPSIYQSRTTLIIGRTVYEPNPTGNDLYLTQQLASFYTDLALREPIRNATMLALGLDWLPEYTASPLPNSQLLEIKVNDTNPIRAQAVANELANQLIKQTPTNSGQLDQTNQEFINQQLNTLREKITETNDEIAKKQVELEDLNSARQIAEIQQEITLLESKLSTLESNYALLLANSKQGAINTLTIIEPATLPIQPIGPNKKMIILLSTVIALAVAAGAVYLMEYLDDTLKTSEEIMRLLNLPVIGYLPEISNTKNEGTFVAKQPRSAKADAFRTLRTNLEFMSVEKPLQSILISSVGTSEGKTHVTSNLAIIMAQGGKKVVILDADLQKPNIHNNFEISNQKGLSDVFRGHAELEDVIQVWGEEKLRIITSGKQPPNPSDLLGSQKMDSILERLKQMADIVIIDGPPLSVNDAVVLAKKVDGVLLVIRYGYTRRGIVKNVLEQLNRIGARVVGVALNWLPRSSDEYIGHYHYYSDEHRKNGRESTDETGISKDIKSKGRQKVKKNLKDLIGW